MTSTLATLIIYDEESRGYAEQYVTHFSLSAPQFLKDILGEKVREQGGVLSWATRDGDDSSDKTNNSRRSNIGKILYNSIDLHIFLSWIEDNFGKIEHVCYGYAIPDSYCHSYKYIFRRSTTTPTESTNSTSTAES